MLFFLAFVAFVVLFVALSKLRRRVSALEGERDALRHWVEERLARERAPEHERLASMPPEVESEPALASPLASEPSAQRASEFVSAPESSVVSPPPSESDLAPAQTPVDRPPSPRPLPKRPLARTSPQPAPDWTDHARRWFSEGNVPVKVGMLVLLAGIGALLKYASDAGWLRLPIEWRLVGVALSAVAGLVFAWTRRESKRTFALSLQGGAIGVLLLTVYAASRLYGFISLGQAFALSVVLVAGACVMAVVQNAQALALFAVSAGFLAPIWLSTGEGQHVVLFSYYALLNVGLLAMSYQRAWRALHVVGFVFTFGIGSAWGVLHYAPEAFATTEPFLVLFFSIYLLVPMFEVRRGMRANRLSGALVFGLPLIAFLLQAGLVEGRLEAAFSALGLAAIYAVLASLFIRKDDHVELAQAWAVIAIGFATLAVPLALSAHTTAVVFALEGAGLVWLAERTKRRLPAVTGIVLQLAGAVAYVIGSRWSAEAMPLLNASFSSMFLLAVGAGASAWTYWTHGRRVRGVFAFIWGAGWWFGAGISEIERFVDHAHQADASLVLMGVSALLFAALHRLRPVPESALGAFLSVMSAVLIAPWQVNAHVHPLFGAGGVAWGTFTGCVLGALRFLRLSPSAVVPWVQGAFWFVWAVMLSVGAHDVAVRWSLGNSWEGANVLGPWLVLGALVLKWPGVVAFPLGKRFERSLTGFATLVVSVIGLLWFASLHASADASPLPDLPLLNPLEVTELGAMAVVAGWFASSRVPHGVVRARGLVLWAMALATLSIAMLRVVHHHGDEPWSTAILRAGAAQMTLTVVWSVFGVASWVWGSLKGNRRVWMAGASLMAVVLVKLLVVDRGHLGNLAGIGSFIAYGLLCTLVGYFAPAPPKADVAPGEATE